MDRSEGWDGIADRFMAARSDIGTALVRRWARENLPPGGTVVDVGCGSGAPIAQALAGDGFTLFGIDPAPRLIEAFRRRLPAAHNACEAAQDSRFFDRTFDGAIAIGLLFLLSADDQRRVVRRMADALKPGGRLLFSAPREPCEWQDVLTGRGSLSLGEEAYRHLLDAAGLRLVGCHGDEGGNHYYDAVRREA